MARSDPSRQVSIVALRRRISYWAKRPNIQPNVKHKNHTFSILFGPKIAITITEIKKISGEFKPKNFIKSIFSRFETSSFNCKSTILKTSFSFNVWKTIFSSIRFNNSGLKTFFTF